MLDKVGIDSKCSEGSSWNISSPPIEEISEQDDKWECSRRSTWLVEIQCLGMGGWEKGGGAEGVEALLGVPGGVGLGVMTEGLLELTSNKSKLLSFAEIFLVKMLRQSCPLFVPTNWLFWISLLILPAARHWLKIDSRQDTELELELLLSSDNRLAASEGAQFVSIWSATLNHKVSLVTGQQVFEGTKRL